MHIGWTDLTGTRHTDVAAAQEKRNCDVLMRDALDDELDPQRYGWGPEASPDSIRWSPRVLHERIQSASNLAVRCANPKGRHAGCEPFGGRFPDLGVIVDDELDCAPVDAAEFRRRANHFGIKGVDMRWRRP